MRAQQREVRVWIQHVACQSRDNGESTGGERRTEVAIVRQMHPTNNGRGADGLERSRLEPLPQQRLQLAIDDVVGLHRLCEHDVCVAQVLLQRDLEDVDLVREQKRKQ